MASKSPLALVKETFGDKAKLVSAVEKLAGQELWLARTNEQKGLAHVSNAKLLRLHATFTEVKEKFGTREKLVDALLELQKRSKDAGLRATLLKWPVPRLYDTYKSTAKRLHAGVESTKVKAPKIAAGAPPKSAAKKSSKAASASKDGKKAAKKSQSNKGPRRQGA
jgi:hypothetical protein